MKEAILLLITAFFVGFNVGFVIGKYETYQLIDECWEENQRQCELIAVPVGSK